MPTGCSNCAPEPHRGATGVPAPHAHPAAPHAPLHVPAPHAPAAPAAPAAAHALAHVARQWRRHRRFFDGAWWWWGPEGWIVIEQRCARWSAPLDVEASGLGWVRELGLDELRASEGQPVIDTVEGLGEVLFTLEDGAPGPKLLGRYGVVVRQCVDQGTLGAAVDGSPPAAAGAATLGDPVPPLRTEFHPRGQGGVRKSIEEVRAQIWRDVYEDPSKARRIVEWARRTVAEAKLPDPRGFPNDENVMRALFEGIKRDIAFVRDPYDAEFTSSTVYLLCLDPEGPCLKAGDCDEQIIGLGAAAMSVGILVRLLTRYYANQPEAHIVLQYRVRQRDGSYVWKCIDPSLDSGQCSNKKAVYEVVVEIDPRSDVEKSEGGTFMGLGSPQGTLGDAPATLSDQESAGWYSYITGVRNHLAGARDRLRRTSDAYAKVRADLGLPANDPDPGGETNLGPLGVYLKTGAWTTSAEAAEHKMLATSDFVLDVLDDALAGRRQIYYDPAAKDCGVESKPGDPYLFHLDPNGVPTYLDPQSQKAQGTLGILPIIIGVAVIAVVVGAAWVLGKMEDATAAKHHDDMLSRIADQQNARITSGKTTPEQEAKLTQALSDFSAASQPPKSSGLFGLPDWVTIPGAALLGIGAGILVAKFLPFGKGA